MITWFLICAYLLTCYLIAFCCMVVSYLLPGSHDYEGEEYNYTVWGKEHTSIRCKICNQSYYKRKEIDFICRYKADMVLCFIFFPLVIPYLVFKLIGSYLLEGIYNGSGVVLEFLCVTFPQTCANYIKQSLTQKKD